MIRPLARVPAARKRPRTTKPQRRVGAGRLVALAMGATLMIALTACGGGGSSSGSSSSSDSNTTKIPLQIAHGGNNSTLAIVPVMIQGKGPYPFILDTGASVSLIVQSLAQQLNLPKTSGKQPVRGVSGSTNIVFRDIKSWKVGTSKTNVNLPNMSIGSGKLAISQGSNNVDGLLGSDVWSQFGKITLDYTSGTLTLYKTIAARPASAVVAAAASGTFGLEWRRAA